MKINYYDLWDEEIFVGDKVRVGFNSYTVKYGNFKYFGTDRIGIYLDNTNNSADTIPLAQAKSLIKIKEDAEIYN